jgi:hypothetical protein
MALHIVVKLFQAAYACLTPGLQLLLYHIFLVVKEELPRQVSDADRLVVMQSERLAAS